MRIIFAALMLLLTGCITRQKCMDRYPPDTGIVSVEADSSHVEDTSFSIPRIVYLPGDSVFVEKKIPCDEADINVTKNNNGFIATLTVKNGVARCDCKEDSLKAVVFDLIKQRNEFRQKTKTVTVTKTHTVVKKETPFEAKLCIWLLVGIILFLLFQKVKKKWLTFLSK